MTEKKRLMSADLPESEWLKICEEWESSQLSQSKFCELKNIAYTTFSYWRTNFIAKHKLQSKRISTPPSLPSTPFVEVKAEPLGTSSSDIKIRFPNGIVMMLGKHVERQQIKYLFELLGVV
jgi:hypothetical protein